MKRKIIIYSLFALVVSCNSQEPNPKKNILLGDKVKVHYVVNFDNKNNPDEWLYGMEQDKLFKQVTNEVYINHKPVYSPNQSYLVGEQLTEEQTKEQCSGAKPSEIYKEFTEAMFVEEWVVPENLKSFTKQIEYWSPVRVWNPKPGSDELYKKLMFFIEPSGNTKGELVANSIFTEFEIYAVSFPTGWSGFDGEKFVNYVFDNIENGKVKAYDPIYLVDKTEKTFSVAGLEQFLGKKLSSPDLRKSVHSFIFEENWYFDPASMNIYKEVLSVGFVRKYVENFEQKTKILFFLKFN
jgi:hypothetical protein